MISSTRRLAHLLPLLVLLPPATAQPVQSYTPAPAATEADINAALSRWRGLRQSGNFAFSDYARFIIANPDWPSESTLRLRAEKAMRIGEHPDTVLAFFQRKPPTTGNGFAQYALALVSLGRTAEALNAARNAWAAGDLGPEHDQHIYSRFGTQLTWAEHDRRADALLFAKKASDAERLLPLTSAGRRPALAARIAMQKRAADAEAGFQAVSAQTARDPGLLMDRLRYLRDRGNEGAARQLAAREHSFAYPPEDAARFYEMLLILAGEAASDRQYSLAYNIARQVDDALAPGTDLATQPLEVRDHYTSLMWLSGTIALDRLAQPADAILLFDRYSRGGRSLQVQSKGLYWAGRAALAAGQPTVASSYFLRASAFPDLFYGQLGLERLGRPVPRPASMPGVSISHGERAEFMNRSLVQATRSMIASGSFAEREQFIRALGESLKSDADRILAVEMGQQMGRQNVPVWVARTARLDGSNFYVEPAYPRVSGTFGNVWSLSHGVARQESSFDKAAVSHAGARGMMQLMVPTAREQAGKIGISFGTSRLLSDPAYNMQIGSAYFRWLLNYWDGSIPLAVASYNAGMGNVRKWVNAYGDPRSGTDMLKWIESIPFLETRGYVQRVIENSVVYDTMNPEQRVQAGIHVSRYLGKSRPG